MINGHKKVMFLVIFYVMSVSSDVQAYITTFINDSMGKAAIFNELDKTFMCIPKNKKRRFGNHHKNAHFVIYTQQPKVKIEIWTPLYTCKQTKSDSSGNAVLKFSDIQNNTPATSLFTITKHKPHLSMVGELPMIQKNVCEVCPSE